MNEIKNIVLKTNNFLIIALFVIVLCFSGITILSGAVWQGIVFLIAGIVVASLMSGYYILIHSILIENEKQSKLLENILKALEKQLMPFKQLPADYRPEIDLIDRRQQYVEQVVSQKEKLIEEAFRLLIGDEDIKLYKGRLHCLVNPAKVETYTLDEIPVIEIHPMEFKNEYNEHGDPTLMAYYNYRILYKGDRND